MEKSVYIIKPEGMIFRSEIIKAIEQRALTIEEKKNLVLPEWALKELYPDLSVDLWNATCLSFSAPVEIGLISGEKAVQVLFRLAGKKTAPAECDSKSIRFIFGRKEPFVIGGVRYYANAIHRPKNKLEARNDMEVFQGL